MSLFESTSKRALLEAIVALQDASAHTTRLLEKNTKNNRQILLETESRVDAFGSNLLVAIKRAYDLLGKVDTDTLDGIAVLKSELVVLGKALSEMQDESAACFKGVSQEVRTVASRMDGNDALLRQVQDAVSELDLRFRSLMALVESCAASEQESLKATAGGIHDGLVEVSRRIDSYGEVLTKLEAGQDAQLSALSKSLFDFFEDRIQEEVASLKEMLEKVSGDFLEASGRIAANTSLLESVQANVLSHQERGFASLLASIESHATASARKIHEILPMIASVDAMANSGKQALNELKAEQFVVLEKVESMSMQLERLEALAGLDEKGSRLRTVFFRQARLERKLDELLTREEQSALDLMLLLNRIQPFEKSTGIFVETGFPLAEGSDDHRFPFGTAQDNTRCPRFVAKCEALFPQKLSYLDLGCSGGGLVLDFTMAGHNAVGLEGSDYSRNTKRAAWRVLNDSLFTADISKPFAIKRQGEDASVQFEIISAWEVMEHLDRDELVQLLSNVRKHLASGGFFVGSINTRPDFDEESGAVYHKTVKEKAWWERFFEEQGLCLLSEHAFSPYDFPRGVGGRLYDSFNYIDNPEDGFHFVAKEDR